MLLLVWLCKCGFYETVRSAMQLPIPGMVVTVLPQICGEVTDGLLKDIDKLTEGSAVSANWKNFEREQPSENLNDVRSVLAR